MKVLETERLILRGFNQNDLDDIYEYGKDPDIGPRVGWQPHDTKETTQKILDMFITEQDVWAIELKENNKLVGTIGLHDRAKSNIKQKELGYVLNRCYWGQGIMPEACKEVIKYGFLDEKLEKITIGHYTFNKQSKRVIEKLGFVYEGTTRHYLRRFDGVILDCCMYSMLRNEYIKKNDDFRTLETKRLIIRKFESNDLDDMFEYANDPNIGPNAGWPPHQNKDETKKILDNFIKSNEHRAIVIKDTGKVIGGISLMKKEDSTVKKREIGYVLNRNYWGQGIMPEACQELIRYAFEEKKLDKIEIFHYPFNKQSKRVIEKMGFTYEGTRRKDFKRYDGEVLDSMGYSMLRSEYEEAVIAFNKKYPKEEL